MEKKERLSHKITTENRQATIDKRETSWQQLAEKLDNGDDGIYNISNHARGKALLLQPKVSITKKDLEEIAELRQLREAIDSIDRQVKEAPTGRNKFILKSTLIEMRRSQYIIKDAFRKPLYPNKLIHTYHSLEMPEEVYFDSKGFPCSKEISFLNKKVVREILNNYERLKLEAADRIQDDIWYLMYDFDKIIDEALKDYPIYKKIFELKTQGMQSLAIQQELKTCFNVNYSPEFISTVWCKKIPKFIISLEEDKYLKYYYLNIEKGKYKKCNRCGQIKLAHNKYFSKNKTSGDGFYSICKECRNKKK